ncbi:hypothetical protein PQ469_12065 [Mucilaginibacter sp. KACC 22773]|uniref:hypothetical protein n=1 Tax=Mucilaginibacter sp. KACC 22773 TaxID=3025671 RepID=UPI002366FD27|nr:hypothetical protein [Mucilaginibacter sp. KACC 22773]WDF80742.1 hypothetical protein PQ469_12065 [Mucilaginibacter sp. KACC 22773]
MSYHAGGIKVQETPSWTGAGWALFAGGQITRTIKGAPDDANSGFASTSNIVPICPNDWSYDVYYSAESGNPDWEPDVFSYTCPAGSGKFVLDQSGNVHQMPQTNLKIAFTRVAGRFEYWTITDANGVVYEFNQPEKAFSTIPSPGINYNASWYMTAIKPTTGNSADNITLEYQAYSTENQQFSSETVADNSTMDSYANITISQTQAMLLSKINYAAGSVNFIPGAFRHDLKGGQTLSSITVKDINGNLMKTFNFSYNYFGGTGFFEFSGLTPATATTTANTSFRLSLKSLQELDANNTPKPAYQFIYETGAWLPDRLNSKALDHWGYYNGKDGNLTLIASYQNGFINGAPIYTTGSGGGNRYPDESFAKAGSLKQIIYPTGGSTTFVYENNRVNTSYYQLDYSPQQFNFAMAVSACNVSPPVNFTVNNYPGNAVAFKINFQSYVPSATPITCTGNTTPITVANPATNLFFKIFKATDLNNPVYTSSGQMIVDGTTKSGSDQVGLANGDYVLRICKYGQNTQALASDATTSGSYSFTMSGVQYSNPGYKLAGGLRIKEILNTDPITNNVIDKTFEYIDGAQSSGTLSYIPTYVYKFEYGPNGSYVINVRTSVANVTSDDDGVSYSKVTVYEGKNPQTQEVGTNGKTEYIYTVPVDYVTTYTYSGVGSVSTLGYNNFMAINSTTSSCYTDAMVNNATPINYSYGVTYPFVPNVSQGWRRGLLLNQFTYSKVAGNYIMIKSLTNTYKDDYYGSNTQINHSTDVLGARVATYFQEHGVAPDGTPAGSAVYKGISYYYYPSRLNKLIETDEIQFDANGLKPVTTTTSYVYGNLEHQLVTQKTMLTSSGDNFISVYKYPSDFSSQQPYTDMYTRHIWGPVVEQLNYKNSLSNFLNSVKTDYAAWGTVIAPNVVSSKTGINAYEPRLHYYTYDNQGNEVETGKDLGPRTCYIWSYAGRYPIAKVENAVYSDIVSALGGVTAVENFKNNILPTDAQVKSFLTPLMASSTYQVSTFTCNPILGITSSTDAKGLVTYYEYDSFQRLLNIKDKDGNIIKHMDYHYANN